MRARTPEVRSIRTSLLIKIFGVQRGLRVGAWNSQMTFTSFHLRDVTHRSMDLLPLGLWWLLHTLCNSRSVAVDIMVTLDLLFVFPCWLDYHHLSVVIKPSMAGGILGYRGYPRLQGVS